MKVSISFFLALCLSTSLSAQEGWFWQNPSPQGNTLYDILVLDENTAVAVGALGTIIRTDDGGTNWTFQNSGILEDLFSVFFPDSNTGYVVGEKGTIIKTTDGGSTWSPVKSGISYDLNSTFFVNADTGWVVGQSGIILKTTDGGKNWYGQPDPFPSILEDVYFIDSETGWIAGQQGLILKTTDGGKIWEPLATGTSQDLFAIFFIDAFTGWAVGSSGLIVKTTDGGITWTPQNSGTSATLRSLSFSDAQTGWVVGEDRPVIDRGVLLKTVDGGLTWETIDVGKTRRLWAVGFGNTTTGWAVGDFGEILQTKDGGVRWDSQKKGTTATLRDLHFVDENLGWAVGGDFGANGIIINTRDGGENWTAQRDDVPQALSSVDFIDSTKGWASGVGGILLHTEDGGKNWLPQHSGTSSWLLSITFPDALHGWAVGFDGTILNTNDGGATWNLQNSGVSEILISVFSIDSLTGWTVGRQGLILKTTDGGTAWKIQDAGSTERLNSVYFLDANLGWIAGDGGTIFKTTDGGATWMQVNKLPIALKSIFFVGANRGWTVGMEGKIFQTQDGGNTWEASTIRTRSTFESVFFVNAQTGWVTGDMGTILKTNDGGENITLTEIPKARRKLSVLDANQIKITFSNHGFFGTRGSIPTVFWPKEAGLPYLFQASLLVGGEVVDLHGNTVHIISDGMINFMDGDFAPGTTNPWGWQPLEGFDNPDQDSVAVSDDPGTWPPNWESWQGRYGPGMLLADLETLWVMNDRDNAEFAYFPLQSDSRIRGLGIQIVARGYQWQDPAFEDFIIFTYEIQNIGDKTLEKLVIGWFVDPQIGGDEDFFDDFIGFDLGKNLVYAFDQDSVNVAGARTGYLGFLTLEAPDDLGLTSVAAPLFGGNNRAKNDDLIWSLLTPGNFSPLEQNADNVLIFGSGYFSLIPGETKTHSMAIVMGEDLDDLFKNAQAAKEAFSLITSVKTPNPSVAPKTPTLFQNYPNPFNPETTVEYEVAQPGPVRLTIYNLLGQRVRTLVNAWQPAGSYRVRWDGRGAGGRAQAASGVYVYELRVGEEAVQRKKMVLLR